MKLQKIVIKPFCACNANCYACTSRRELYKKFDRSLKMPIKRIKQVLKEGRALGARHIAISGGEPLLYQDLYKLLNLCKKRGFIVAINTNGSLMTKTVAEKLIKGGSDAIYLSLDSYQPAVHNFLRRTNIWDKAVNGLDNLIEVKKETKAKTIIGIRSIMTKYILRNLDKMILLGIKRGIDAHQLSYVEYDKETILVPSIEDVLFFRKNVVPKLEKIINNLKLKNKSEILKSINSLFAPQKGKNYQKSIYCSQETAIKKCFRPFTFAIILQNGDVAPCNLVEYTHHPIIGNIYQNSLKEILINNPKLEKFRRERFPECTYCPMLIHKKLNYFEGYSKGEKYNEKFIGQ